MVDSAILAGVFLWSYLAVHRIWNNCTMRRKENTMIRQSPLKTVTLAKVEALLQEQPDVRPLMADLYFTALMDGMHAQTTGHRTENPFDGSLPLF